MSPAATAPTRKLSTAEERRETVLEAAMEVFAERGFTATPTMDIAKAAGISQAYLFRLFPTKIDLVLAVVERSNQRIYDTFREVAAAGARRKARRRRGARARPTASCSRTAGCCSPRSTSTRPRRACPRWPRPPAPAFERLVELVERETGGSPEEIQSFFAHGMLMNVMAAIGAEDKQGRWASILRVCEARP